MKWLEVTLTVEQELVEPIAELLARITTHGIATQADSPDLISVTGWLKLDQQLPNQKQALEEGLWHLSQINPLPDPSYREVEGDWLERWKSRYIPFEIGKNLLIIPNWVEPPSGQRQVVIIEPGKAFGSGAHGTTRMCLEMLEETVQPGDRVLDLGCGSGILAITAALLGAGSVLALDTDPEAVNATIENIARNEVDGIVEAEQGSLADAQSREPFDLIMANILSRILLNMLQADLSTAARPGGSYILSGIFDDQVDKLLAEALARDLVLVEQRSQRDWRTLLLKRNTAT